MSKDANDRRKRRRRTRGAIPGRRRSVELHAQYVKLLILVITLILDGILLINTIQNALP